MSLMPIFGVELDGRTPAYYKDGQLGLLEPFRPHERLTDFITSTGAHFSVQRNEVFDHIPDAAERLTAGMRRRDKRVLLARMLERAYLSQLTQGATT